MTEREKNLLAAATKVLDRCYNGTIEEFSAAIRKLKRSLRPYDEPPPITSEPGFDGRDNSIGMTANAINESET